VKLTHAFDVPASPQATLALLLDPERVVPCLPGAALTEVVDERTWKTTMKVKLGPVGMDFVNDVQLTEVDEAAGRVRMQVRGRDTKGKGSADASVESTMSPMEGGGTRVEVVSDVRFSGPAAQLGRPSIVQDVSNRLMDQFVSCLSAQLTATSSDEPTGPGPEAPRPISGLSLLVAALRGAVVRFFSRAPGRGSS
jgi:carbon monoxide dehydrogenase subunit G